jgi:hypothetical protein
MNWLADARKALRGAAKALEFVRMGLATYEDDD